jgi:outer membrane lipoprotein-sorting protein
MAIAKMVDERKAPQDIVSKTTMLLTNSKGKTRTSTILSKSINNSSKQILWFLNPADDKGVAFLKIEHVDKADEMRMWLPAFKKVRRISSSKKGDSFMGSDLSYEDMTSRALDENNYKRLENDMIDGKECFVLEVVPNAEIKSTYSKHITWVEKETLIAIKEESYDLGGSLRKKKKFFFDSISGYDVINEIFVEDIQKNHTTKLTMDDIKVDSDIDESLFQEKNLKRLPRN